MALPDDVETPIRTPPSNIHISQRLSAATCAPSRLLGCTGQLMTVPEPLLARGDMQQGQRQGSASTGSSGWAPHPIVRSWAATMWPITGSYAGIRLAVFVFLIRGLVGLLGSKDPESGASTNLDSRLQRAEALGGDGHDVALLITKRLVASRSRCNPEQ
jgi:hypothetical protein